LASNYGNMGFTMFKTVALPNAITGWTFCGNLFSSGRVNYSEADNFHRAGVNVLPGDGSVRFSKNTVNQNIWWGLETRAKGEVIGSDQY
jgi:hypothetical protein